MKCLFRGHDLVQKVDKTICRYKGVPYYCRIQQEDNIALYYIYNIGSIHEIIPCDHEDFDVSSLPLGYFQKNKNTVLFVERKPHRKWKQGISQDNVHISDISGEVGKFYSNDSIFSKGFSDSVEDKFPDVIQTLESFRNQGEDLEVAISRDVAMKWISDLQITHVFYRGKVVGFIPINSYIVFVPNHEMSWVVTKYLSSFHWEIK